MLQTQTPDNRSMELTISSCVAVHARAIVLSRRFVERVSAEVGA